MTEKPLTFQLRNNQNTGPGGPKPSLLELLWLELQLPPLRETAEVDILEDKAGREEKPGWD